ncbi:NACHT domain-containing protein [Streptomyces sp. JCM17656]|nr:NACHT domain-containing protein [Streptomyces sp. JCM17656]
MSGVAPRSRVRRVGIVYLTLLGVGTLGALLVAPRVEDPAAVVAALLPTLAGAYLAWSAYRADRAEAASTPADPGDVADRLAVAVRRQWEAEARARRLADPYPLPVAWHGADVGLAEVTEGLAGRDGEIGTILAGRMPDPRLLVLGAPGSGKTLLLVRLLLALIEDRTTGDPVPVLFPLASWNPTAVDLRGWMERKLVQDHAELGVPAPAEYGDVSLARMLLERRLVLPVLDGFDELPAGTSGLALHRIGEALPYGCGLVLSSRPAEYRAALRPRTGVPARLSGMAGIELEPLDASDVSRYLLRDAGGDGTPAAARWAPVVSTLGTGTPAARALTSPLTVSLARAVYNPRPGSARVNSPSRPNCCGIRRGRRWSGICSMRSSMPPIGRARSGAARGPCARHAVRCGSWRGTWSAVRTEPPRWRGGSSAMPCRTSCSRCWAASCWVRSDGWSKVWSWRSSTPSRHSCSRRRVGRSAEGSESWRPGSAAVWREVSRRH